MPPARGAGADRHQGRGLAAQLDDLVAPALAVLIEPSTSRTSYGPSERRDVASGNSTMSNRSPIGEQLVLEVEQRQLAAVARGELDDADARPAGGADPTGGTSQPLRRERRTELGEAEDRAVLADEEAAHLAVAAQADAALHVPLERDPRPVSSGMPRSKRTSTVACIIRSGPQTNASVRRPMDRSNRWVTMPTRPDQSGPARSTVSVTSMSPRAARRPTSAT